MTPPTVRGRLHIADTWCTFFQSEGTITKNTSSLPKDKLSNDIHEQFHSIQVDKHLLVII